MCTDFCLTCVSHCWNWQWIKGGSSQKFHLTPSHRVNLNSKGGWSENEGGPFVFDKIWCQLWKTLDLLGEVTTRVFTWDMTRLKFAFRSICDFLIKVPFSSKGFRRNFLEFLGERLNIGNHHQEVKNRFFLFISELNFYIIILTFISEINRFCFILSFVSEINCLKTV